MAFSGVKTIMPAAVYDLQVEKGVDFSIGLVLQRANGDYVDLTDSGVCVKSDIVEFYGVPSITSFQIEEVLPSGVNLSLTEEQTLSLPYSFCFYDIILNTNGNTERLVQGKIYTSEASTINVDCD